MYISVFKGSISTVEPSDKITLLDFLNDVQNGKHKDDVAIIRKANSEEEVKRLKKKLLDYVTISGTFTSRAASKIQQHSGYIALDLDHLEDETESIKQRLTKDPYTFAIFKSVSGKGLCVVVKTSTVIGDHGDHYRFMEDYYKSSYSDFILDEQCKDISRARFVSHDPNLFRNPESKIAGKKKEPKRVVRPIAFAPTTSSQIDRIVAEICGNGINIVDSFGDWWQCALSIASELGESGRNHFHNLSMISEKYKQSEVDKKYSRAVNEGNGSVTIASFLSMAKNAGVELFTAEEKQAFQLARAAKRSKSNIEAAVSAAENLGLDANLTTEIAEKVFESSDFDYKIEGDSIISEILSWIKINSSLEVNEFTKKLENKGVPINDTFHDSVYIKAKDQISEKVTKTDVNAILNSDVIPYFNPIDRWVKEHEHLPNKPEVIDQLLDTIPYKNPNARSFIKHWLLGIPATHAGEVVRLVLVLCGKQETGKTYWFRELLPESLQCYYSENNLMKDSEIHLALSSNIINMDDEFGGKSRKDALKFKEITSKKNFDVRLLYGNAMSSLKRRAMLCGTSNETEILNDETGNTRILPVEFHKKYNFKLYNSIDKDQLFIEIFRAYKRGESWQLDDDAKKTLDETNSAHSITDIELEMVDEYLFVNTEQYNKSIMSTTECKIHLEKVTGQKIISIRKLGLALKKRFEQIIIKVDGKTKRGYRCVTDKTRNQATESQEVTEKKAPF